MPSLDFKKKIQEAHELRPSLWVKGMLNESGLPLEFSNHRFLIDPYNDTSQFQVILKPPQIGATTMKVLKALYMASHRNEQIIYTLPTQTDVYEMVSSSFNRLIAQNPDLKSLVQEGDTVSHKFVGNGVIRFRGTWTDKQAMMYPSTLNIHDEVDASDLRVITLMENRLAATPNGKRWYFSHPSIAGTGVDVYWEQSDKKEWFITCPNCHEEQILTWPESISVERLAYVCKHCDSEILDSDRTRGKWIATASGNFSGYHISQLMCPWISAEKIIEAKNDPLKDEQFFYNYVLGLPYAASEDVVTTDQVLQNVTDEFNAQEDRVVIGVDTGNLLHYVLMNKEGVFNFGATEPPGPNYDPYAHLEGFLLRWPRSIIVFDAQGDIIGPQQLQQKYPGRIYRCFYVGDRKSFETITWGDKDKFGEVRVDRERMIQLVVEQLRDGRFKLNGTREEWMPFAQHFANMLRENDASEEEKKRGIVKYRWKKNGGRPDHWAHALVYAMVGFDQAGEPEVTMPDYMKGFKEGRMSIQGNDILYGGK